MGKVGVWMVAYVVVSRDELRFGTEGWFSTKPGAVLLFGADPNK